MLLVKLEEFSRNNSDLKCSIPNKTKRLKNETTNAFPVRHGDNF